MKVKKAVSGGGPVRLSLRSLDARASLDAQLAHPVIIHVQAQNTSTPASGPCIFNAWYRGYLGIATAYLRNVVLVHKGECAGNFDSQRGYELNSVFMYPR